MNAPDTTVGLLGTVPCFAGLGAKVLQALALRTHPKSFGAGQPVFTEGDPCRHLYLLESGRVKFYRTSADGREQTMKLFEHPGDMFCIPSAFRTGSHIVSARAVTEARLRLLDVEAVNRLAEAHPSMALKLVAVAGEHMMHLVALAEDLSLKTAIARLAKHLCELAAGERADTRGELRLSRDRLPEEELASMLGTVRVHVSRSLMSLVGTGAIDLDRRFVRIRNLTALKQIAEGK